MSLQKNSVLSFFYFLLRAGLTLLVLGMALCAFFHFTWWPSRETESQISQILQTWRHGIPTLRTADGNFFSLMPGFVTNSLVILKLVFQNPESGTAETFLIRQVQQFSLLFWGLLGAGLYFVLRRDAGKRSRPKHQTGRLLATFISAFGLFFAVLIAQGIASQSSLGVAGYTAVNILALCVFALATVATAPTIKSGLFMALFALEAGGIFNLIGPFLVFGLSLVFQKIAAPMTTKEKFLRLKNATLPFLCCTLLICSFQLPLFLQGIFLPQPVRAMVTVVIPLLILAAFFFLRIFLIQRQRAERSWSRLALPAMVIASLIIFVSSIFFKFELRRPHQLGFTNFSPVKYSAIGKVPIKTYSTRTLKGRADLNCSEQDSFEMKCGVYAIQPTILEIAGLIPDNQRTSRIFLDGRPQPLSLANTAHNLVLTPGPHEIFLTHHFGALELLGALCFLISTLSLIPTKLRP